MKQYLRKVNLYVNNAKGDGLDLASLRVSFKIKKTDSQTPNTAEIRIYNLSSDTATQIKKEFSQVTLQAGYEDNYGVIFAGNIKQIRIGREGVDAYLDIYAGDGDDAYNFGTVNTTLAAGATQTDQINASVKGMNSQAGNIDGGGNRLPRGKVMYGMSRDYLRQSSASLDASWSIQDGRVQVLKNTSILPNQAVMLNSKSGLVGVPEQTNDGIKTKCLLNPILKIGAKVQIDQKLIAEAKIEDAKKDSPANKAPSIEADGFYKILTIEHSGDTRGNDWYSEFECIGVDATLPAKESVKNEA